MRKIKKVAFFILSKKKGNAVCQLSSETSIDCIFLLESGKAIRVKYANYAGDYPNDRIVKEIKYVKTKKMFIQ